MAIRMFRTPKQRKYNYNPRYYNPDKADLEARIRMAELKADDSIDGAKARISSQMKRGRSSKAYKSERKKAMMRSNLLLIAIIIVLIAVAVYGVDVYLPEFMEKFNIGTETNSITPE